MKQPIKLIELTDLALEHGVIRVATSRIFASERLYADVLKPDTMTAQIGQTIPMRLADLYIFMGKSILEKPELSTQTTFTFFAPLIKQGRVFEAKETAIRVTGKRNPVGIDFSMMAFILPTEEVEDITWPK